MKHWNYILGSLALLVATLWLAAGSLPDGKLHLIACDVGQGDAILAVYGDFQILTDGGPDKEVLDCLSRHLPFWDRTIEVVVLTHPDLDHYGGLTWALKHYRVKKVLMRPILPGSQNYEVLKSLEGGGEEEVIDPKIGRGIRYGLLQLDIVGGAVNSSDDNDLSIITRLSLGEFRALLTGDATSQVLENISGPVNYLKVSHHGSRTGLTPLILAVLQPEIAVISAGKGNSYGHPHPEVLTMLQDARVRILRTDIGGDIEVVTDGKKIWLRE